MEMLKLSKYKAHCKNKSIIILESYLTMVRRSGQVVIPQGVMLYYTLFVPHLSLLKCELGKQASAKQEWIYQGDCTGQVLSIRPLVC